MSQIQSYWEDLNEQINEGKMKMMAIISVMQRIKKLLLKLPKSKKAEMQPHLLVCVQKPILLSIKYQIVPRLIVI